MRLVIAALVVVSVEVIVPHAAAQAPRPAPTPGPGPGGPGDGGPRMHQIMSATSADGLTWTHDGVVLLDQASVPAAIVTAEGHVRLYYVDASTMPENVNCAESRDEGRTFDVLNCTIEGRGGVKAVDPSIVLLPDGRYRLYYYASPQNPGAEGLHAIHAAISDDGLHFVDEGEAFVEAGLVDPDVFWSGRDWLMYVMSTYRHGTVVAKSDDGLSFSYLQQMSPEGFGTTAPVRLNDGQLRLYAFDQGKQTSVRSFLSSNGVSWIMEDGIRLTAPEGKEITDPFVIQLPSGVWKMFFKVSRRPNQNP